MEKHLDFQHSELGHAESFRARHSCFLSEDKSQSSASRACGPGEPAAQPVSAMARLIPDMRLRPVQTGNGERFANRPETAYPKLGRISDRFPEEFG